MMRTVSALFLAAVIGTTGGLVATADMDTPSSSTGVSVSAQPMTGAEITAGGKTPAPKRATGITARGSHTITNKMIAAAGGIPPCKHEDGSAQALPCYWNGKVRGNGKGRSFIAMPPAKKGDDPRFVYLTK